MILKGSLGVYNLEKELAAGGEGAVWTVGSNNFVVAKVYHPEKIASDPKLEKKITYMVNNPPDDSILDQIAWPKDVLRDNSGGFAGFIMPKLDTDTDLKKIYPYPPKKEMPVTTEQKLIIAINICIVISEVHKAGYIFGDFNPMNIGVNLRNGHVAFFDADSYHFTDQKNRETYRCGVGADGYIAPELIQKCHDYGADFLGTPLPTFTKETDEFALAIHIFKLLMNGYTPFNGIKECESASQSSPGTGNVAIERDNYCFKSGNKPQSPATPDLASLPPDVQSLFEKTFIGGSTNPGDRASADEWKKALIEYKDNLTPCSKNSMHFYYKDNAKCPFCDADHKYQQSLMGATQTYGTGSGGSAASQYSFVTPVSVPQSKNTAGGGYYQSAGKTPNQTQKSQKPVWLRILLWVFFFPIMATVTIFRKKKWNILLRLFLILLAWDMWVGAVDRLESSFKNNSASHSNSGTTNAQVVKESNPETTEDTAVRESMAPLGTEILNLKDYAAFDTVAVDDDIPEDFGNGKNWDTALKFRAGNGQSYAYASYVLEGKFNKLTLRMQPFNYGDFFVSGAGAELQIIDLDTGYIVYKEAMASGSLPIDVEADISGIDNLRIMVNRTSGVLAFCVLSDIYVYPGEGSNTAETDKAAAGKYGPDALNLKNEGMYDSQGIDGDIPITFTWNDHLWTNAMQFGWFGRNNAYGVWEIGGKYSTLSLEFLPYYGDYFFEDSSAEIQIINAETDEILYCGVIDYNSDILEVTADVSGVNYLKINVNKIGGVYAFCLLNDIYVYNE